MPRAVPDTKDLKISKTRSPWWARHPGAKCRGHPYRISGAGAQGHVHTRGGPGTGRAAASTILFVFSAVTELLRCARRSGDIRNTKLGQIRAYPQELTEARRRQIPPSYSFTPQLGNERHVPNILASGCPTTNIVGTSPSLKALTTNGKS